MLYPRKPDEIGATLCEIYGIGASDPAANFNVEIRQGAAIVALAFAALTPEVLLR